MEMGVKNFPKNLSPIGNPGPFGVIELGGMFTILKVREGLTSYADPGWYKHPKGTVAESINHDQHNKMEHDHSHIQHEGMNMSQGKTVSWFSQEERRNETAPRKQNWMESKPEDSMGGHMQHKKIEPNQMQESRTKCK